MLKSMLNPSQSVGIGIGMGALDFLIFSQHLPATADIRTAPAGDTDIETARRQSTIMCVGINGLVSVMTRDWNVFLIGGAVTAAMSILVAHANAVHPETGTMKAPGEETSPPLSTAYPLGDYGDSDAVTQPAA
jgi:hypothetical protein